MPSAILAQLATYGPDRCERLSHEQAVLYTRQLAKAHYENFTVVSWMLPRDLRDDFRHVYSFCRWADDLGDETGDRAESLRLLDWWRSELDLCYQDNPRHPVFIALRPTIVKHDIPRKPFDDLIDAFVQDQRVNRYQTFDQVLDYCSRSADPVGRLVLYLCGYRDERRQRLSDHTCTALQLANFWQDVRRDVLERDRCYIPIDIAQRYGLDIELMIKAIRTDEKCKSPDGCCESCSIPGVGITSLRPAFAKTLRELVDRTEPLFEQGHALWPLIRSDVRVDIQLFSLGGQAILRKIRQSNFDTMVSRPSLGKPAKAALLMRALVGKFFAALPGSSHHVSVSSEQEHTLAPTHAQSQTQPARSSISSGQGPGHA